MARTPKTLYHLSPRRNRRGIARHGLQPLLSKGKRQVVWLCDLVRLPHYLEHIARHQGVPISGLDVYAVNVTGQLLGRYRPGIYTSADSISRERVILASDLVEA